MWDLNAKKVLKEAGHCSFPQANLWFAVCWCFFTCVTWDEVEDSNAGEKVLFNNKIKQRRTKTSPKGKKQAGRQKTGAQSDMKHSHDIRNTKDNGSAQDCRHKENYIGRQTRVTRETQLEPLKQWLSNKMGGDRQSTWEHMAPTNNKPCAQHRDIWWPAWAHQQDRDITPPLRSGSQTLHTH